MAAVIRRGENTKILATGFEGRTRAANGDTFVKETVANRDPRKGGSLPVAGTAAGARAERIARMKAKRAADEKENAERVARERARVEKEKNAETERLAAKKAFEADNNSAANNSKNTMSLGLYVFSGVILKKQIDALQSKGFGSTEIGDITYSLVEVTGRSGRLQPLFTSSTEYNFSNKNHPKLTSMDYKLKISSKGEDKFAIISVFFKAKVPKIIVRGGYFDCSSKNGFSGFGSQPRNLVAALFKIKGKTLSPASMPSTKRVNTIASMRSGRAFSQAAFIRDRPSIPGGVIDVKNKGPSRVRVLLGDHVMSITSNGVIQVAFKGDVKKDEVIKVTRKAKSIHRGLSKYFGGEGVVATIKSKAGKRAANKPAPNVARRGTTCPADKRPTPYSFGGKCPPGTYVRPNPQKQPCCYRIPKQKGYYKQRIRGVYTNAGVRMPNSVADIFGVNKNNKNKRVNVANKGVNNAITKNMGFGGRNQQKMLIKVKQMNPETRKPGFVYKEVNSIKIGSRQCTRYTKQQILDFIRRMGYTETAIDKKRKEDLCEIIKKLTKGKNTNMTNAKFVPMIGSNILSRTGAGILKIGTRSCMSYSKPDLQKLCAKAGVRAAGQTREQMCQSLEEFRTSKQSNINAKKARILKAVQNKVEAAKTNVAKTRSDVLYKMFLKKITPYLLNKGASLNSAASRPSQAQFIKHFENDVKSGRARAIPTIKGKGWRASYRTWLDSYTTKYRGAYTLNDNSKNAAERANRLNAALAKRAEKNVAGRKVKLDVYKLNNARADIVKNLRSVIDPKLHRVFDSRVNGYAKKLMNFAHAEAQNRVVTRKLKTGWEKTIPREWLERERFLNGNIRTDLEKFLKNKDPKVRLSRNFKVVKR